MFYVVRGYLIRQRDAQRFLDWSKIVDFCGRWMPEPGESSSSFLGEYPWAVAAQFALKYFPGVMGWQQPERKCPVQLPNVTFEYQGKPSQFDRSREAGFGLSLSVPDIVNGLFLRWTGHGADFCDTAGKLIAQDPSAHASGPGALLLRFEEMATILRKQELTMCWAVLGEKQVTGDSSFKYGRLNTSGGYVLQEDKAVGQLKTTLETR